MVNVQGTQQPTPSSAESFVTVLSIGTGSKQQDKLPEQTTANGVDPAHPEEEVEVYRLPGERLGFGLKFEGGNKTSEKVRRLFIQSCAEQSPASRAKCSWGNLGEGDEVSCFSDALWLRTKIYICIHSQKLQLIEYQSDTILISQYIALLREPA